MVYILSSPLYSVAYVTYFQSEFPLRFHNLSLDSKPECIRDMKGFFLFFEIFAEVIFLPTRFMARLATIDNTHLGFYVPKYVKEFYDLDEGIYKGGIAPSEGDLTSCSIKLRTYKHTLRGTLPKNVGRKGSIVEVWLYRHSKVSFKKPT
jgi:hypothetical protein